MNRQMVRDILLGVAVAAALMANVIYLAAHGL